MEIYILMKMRDEYEASSEFIKVFRSMNDVNHYINIMYENIKPITYHDPNDHYYAEKKMIAYTYGTLRAPSKYETGNHHLLIHKDILDDY